MSNHYLEPEAQELADATSKPPFFYELGPERRAQGPRRRPGGADRRCPTSTRSGSPSRPPSATSGSASSSRSAPAARCPTILYIHGGGWVLGNAGTHDRLVRELAVGVEAAVVFVEYDRSPEARYPVAIEQAYATAQWITSHGPTRGSTRPGSRSPVTPSAATWPRRWRSWPSSAATSRSATSRCTTPSPTPAGHRQLPRVRRRPVPAAKAMDWFWDAYLPDESKRAEITASPLRATLEELAGLPEAFVIVDENDVLRDEGEAYARRLVEAGVRTTTVRYNAIIHDFMMLNPLRPTAASTGAIEQAMHVLRKALRQGSAAAADAA